jgi:hypothetical protein
MRSGSISVHRRKLMEGRESLADRHRAEALLSLVSIAATTALAIDNRISKDTAIIVDAVTATLALSVAILKEYFARIAQSLSARERRLESRTGQIASILESLGDPDPRFRYATVIVDSAIERLTLIPKGIFRLDPTDYFRELINVMICERSGAHVLAVNSMSIARFTDDPREGHYLQANIAAVKRGVSIHRIFLLDGSKMTGPEGDQVKGAIIQQREGGISVEIAWYQDIMHDRELHDDFVLFDDSNVLFLDEYDRIDPTRVLRGEKISNPQYLDRYRKVFHTLIHTYCLDRAAVDSLLQ